MNVGPHDLPRLHVVTDDGVLARPDVVDVAAALLEAFPGEIALHVRGPRSAGRRIHEVATRIADRAGTAGLVINDRVDVAITLRAAVHLGARSLPVTAVRDLVAEGTQVGRSIRDHVDEATGADYLFAGPVYPTPSHEELTGRGIPWLAEIRAQSTLRVVAIGGISAERIGVLLDAGVHGVAAIRAVWAAPDPLRAVDNLASQLRQAS